MDLRLTHIIIYTNPSKYPRLQDKKLSESMPRYRTKTISQTESANILKYISPCSNRSIIYWLGYTRGGNNVKKRGLRWWCDRCNSSHHPKLMAKTFIHSFTHTYSTNNFLFFKSIGCFWLLMMVCQKAKIFNESNWMNESAGFGGGQLLSFQWGMDMVSHQPFPFACVGMVRWPMAQS